MPIWFPRPSEIAEEAETPVSRSPIHPNEIKLRDTEEKQISEEQIDPESLMIAAEVEITTDT